MKKLHIKTSPQVESVFDQYPEAVLEKMLQLRKLVLEAAKEIGLTELEEKLKWGEPSYIAKKGSTIRMDWKEKTPDQYALYFQCNSKLVPAFRTVYGKQLKFEGNRAVIFHVDEKLPESILKNCIKSGLQYHKVKNLPELGLPKRTNNMS